MIICDGKLILSSCVCRAFRKKSLQVDLKFRLYLSVAHFDDMLRMCCSLIWWQRLVSSRYVAYIFKNFKRIGGSIFPFDCRSDKNPGHEEEFMLVNEGTNQT